MLRLLSVLLLLTFSFSAVMAQPGPPERVRVIKGEKVKEIGSLKDFKPDPRVKDIAVRDWNGVIWGNRIKPQKPPYDESSADQSEGARQDVYNNKNLPEVPGDNAAFGGVGATTVAPADPTLAVGPNHVIQAANATSGTLFRIFNKNGTVLINDTYLDQVTGFGGLGDPVVLYDQLADRFIMTEFANSGETTNEGLIFAVSKTSDPVNGGWNIYFFSTGSVFPDYPKYSVWPDGYYATSNDFGSSYIGSSIYAFDRAKMLAGDNTATLQTFRFNTTSYSRYFTMCPVLLQGTTLPPSGTG
ncbi:MAG TPA: hypothetical protein VK166_01125, partial [Chitinophagaceae bacterium]|nr:hypothetical protein [Chitinophagaceae bacterium]